MGFARWKSSGGRRPCCCITHLKLMLQVLPCTFCVFYHNSAEELTRPVSSSHPEKLNEQLGFSWKSLRLTTSLHLLGAGVAAAGTRCPSVKRPPSSKRGTGRWQAASRMHCTQGQGEQGELPRVSSRGKLEPGAGARHSDGGHRCFTAMATCLARACRSC